MAGQKDGQILFHRILPATAGGLTSTTAVDWHLKLKDIEYEVGLTKNYCITVSMQKISSVHTIILKIQQILGSHGLNKWPCPFLTTPVQKSVKYLLAFLNLCQHAKNLFIPSIHSWEAVKFRVLWPDWQNTHILLFSPKNFLINFYVNLYQHAKN